MIFRCIEGLNYKNFVLIEDIKTKQDLALYEAIKTILTRREYMRFTPGPNKWKQQTYLIDKYLFPIQFLPEIIEKINKLSKEPIQIINPDLIVKNNISREAFDEYIASLKFPDKYKTDLAEYKFQQDSVYLAIRYGMGKIDVSMSGGKTFITYLYIRTLMDLIFEQDERTIICVPRTILIKQLQSDFKEYNTYMERPIYVESMYAGSKRILNADVVCGTYSSLSNYDVDYFNDFRCFICDEAHTAKAYSIRNEIYAKMYNIEYIFAMTGTMPAYATLDYLHINSMFGPTIVKVETYELIESGIASFLTVEAITINYVSEYINGYAQSCIESGIVGAEKFNSERNLLQNYRPRTELIAKLLNGFPANSMVLAINVEYCYTIAEVLREKLDESWTVYVIHGIHKIYGSVDKDSIIAQLKQSTTKYVVVATFETLGVGISIPNLQNGYLVDGGKSPARISQAYGRLIRLLNGEQKDTKLFDFQDNIKGFGVVKHARERMKLFREKRIPINISQTKI